MKKMVSVLAALCLSWAFATGVSADQTLENKACRSVHLIYPATEGVAFYTEMKVEKSSPGTYFMAAGFNMGYYGIQELYDGKKLLIFSVWDPGDPSDWDAHPDSVKEEQRVKLLYKDESVRVGRFGGEGTGGQSFLDYDWKLGQTYRFCVSAKPNGKRTEYTNWFFVPEENKWKKLVTFSTITGGKYLSGYYSFVEDFLRNGESAKIDRRASYGNGWVKDKNGQWHSLSRARFSGDSNPVMNINAGIKDNWYYLQTGGETKNDDVPLWDYMNRAPEGLSLPDIDAQPAPAPERKKETE